MTGTLPEPLTNEQAEAWNSLMNGAQPLMQTYFAHVERVNEQQRRAARPMFLVAGGIVVSVAAAALWAVVARGDPQLTRDLLLPLLSFAGGLGIGRATTSVK